MSSYLMVDQGLTWLQMDCSRIFGGVEARCLALHPYQPVVAVVRVHFLSYQSQGQELLKYIA